MNNTLKIEEIATLANEACQRLKIDYSSKGVKTANSFINTWRNGTRTEAEVLELTNLIGSYLGETMVRVQNGKWEHSDKDGWKIVLSGSAAFPFAKAYKHIKNGPEESIESFFISFPLIAGHF